MKSLTSSRCRLIASRIQSLDASRPAASTSSLTLGATVGVLDEGSLRTAGFDHHDRDVGFDRLAEGTPGDHEFERGGRRPLGTWGAAPTARRWCRPCAPHRWTVKGDARDHDRRGSGVDREDVVRVFPGRRKDRADDLDFVAKALRNEGRSGRSISRQIRMAWSDSLPSRRKNAPGIFPAAYARSSMSTVRGKKSVPSRTPRDAATVARSIVSPMRASTARRRVVRGDLLRNSRSCRCP